MLKICFLADAKSIHTKRWCEYFQNKGHEIHLITFRDDIIENVNIYFIDIGNIEVKGGNWKTLLAVPEIRKLVKKIKPDIFHSHYATSYGITGALCFYQPFIVTTLGSDILLSPQKSFILRLLLKFVFKKAIWVTAMAEHMKTAIQQLGVNESKISVVPFGIDPEIFNAEKRSVSENNFVITSTRNFEKVYNIPHLLKSIALVKKEIKNLRLNLIGDGSLRSEIEALVEELELTDFTTFYGRISQENIAAVLNQSHLFISVSLSDGNNISLNEAMACGTYCIATDIPANRQWIKNNENGLLVNIDDSTGLSKQIMYVYENYDSLNKTAYSINKEIIEQKANWRNNMLKVEEKYYSLTK